MNRRNSNLKILVLCHDVVGKNMAGPGIRYKYIANVLSRHFSVKLGVFSKENSEIDDNSLVVVDPSSEGGKKFIAEADVIFAQWMSKSMIEYATSLGKVIIFDFYAPVPIEYLAQLEFSKKTITKRQLADFDAILEMYKEYLDIGNFFTCSNERQRDFWTGYLVASQLFKLDDFRNNKIENNFLICPMGIEKTTPKPKELLLRKSIPAIKRDDFVLLWTGGIWDWFDAQVIVRAMSEINDPKIKLVFLGTKHPNPIYKEEMGEGFAARRLAERLGLLNKNVFFMDGWVPYDMRASYFLDANVAIYADKNSLETRFSHRTRVLDHFWVGIPTICSRGDYMSELIEQKNLGIVVSGRESADYVKAILELKNNQKLYHSIKKSLKLNRKEFTWEKTISPLVDIIESLQITTFNKQIKTARLEREKKARMPLKRRIKRSAKILLLGK